MQLKIMPPSESKDDITNYTENNEKETLHTATDGIWRS